MIEKGKKEVENLIDKFEELISYKMGETGQIK